MASNNAQDEQSYKVIDEISKKGTGDHAGKTFFYQRVELSDGTKKELLVKTNDPNQNKVITYTFKANGANDCMISDYSNGSKIVTKKFYGNRPELVSTVGRNGVLKTYGRGVVTIDATLDPKRDKTKPAIFKKRF